ncbi:hypothetical protein ZOSMA_12G00460 [Zostera marina]|uniref:Uncharacterized protein n=1 Tax=Zostera marina TaxID=29655 RepID=A0A0K9Q1F3_ZOSMR|nr:hypothetical protein ZOSMA_12G00460 [Zostera marina]
MFLQTTMKINNHPTMIKQHTLIKMFRNGRPRELGVGRQNSWLMIEEISIVAR